MNIIIINEIKNKSLIKILIILFCEIYIKLLGSLAMFTKIYITLALLTCLAIINAQSPPVWPNQWQSNFNETMEYVSWLG